MTEHTMRFWPDCGTVLAMKRKSGGSDAIEFLQRLQPRYKARYQRYLEYLRDGTPIKSPENLRRLSTGGGDPTVFEIKVDKYRLYMIRNNVSWYATHGREKPKDSRVAREIEKSLTIFWEWNGERS